VSMCIIVRKERGRELASVLDQTNHLLNVLSSDSICELGLCSYLLSTSFGRDHTELPNLIMYGFQCLYVR
jgi:hypothetical protein